MLQPSMSPAPLLRRTRAVRRVVGGAVGNLVLAVAAHAAATAPDHPIDCAALGAAASQRSVAIPAGVFREFFKRSTALDSNDAPPSLPPTPVAAFRLDASVVTRGEYLLFVCEHPAWRKSNVKAVFAEANYLSDWRGDLDPGSRALDQPITHVSWFAARAFCAARNARLPTTAEWERAGGEDGVAPTTGERLSTVADNNTFRFAMGRAAADLRQSSLSFAGIWEWTADFNSVVTDTGGGRTSLFCGDGVRSNNARDYGAFLRYSLRSSLHGNYTLKNLGFRCAEEPAP